MKRYDYNEPLFNVVKTSVHDILTESQGQGTDTHQNIGTDFVGGGDSPITNF
jgi:hypothetical protein